VGQLRCSLRGRASAEVITKLTAEGALNGGALSEAE
jgi:hypothetical protein